MLEYSNMSPPHRMKSNKITEYIIQHFTKKSIAFHFFEPFIFSLIAFSNSIFGSLIVQSVVVINVLLL